MTSWLNHMLVPSRGLDADVDGASRAHIQLLQARRESRIRRRAFDLFHRSAMESTLTAVNQVRGATGDQLRFASRHRFCCCRCQR